MGMKKNRPKIVAARAQDEQQRSVAQNQVVGQRRMVDVQK
jgi:hypothetical protein